MIKQKKTDLKGATDVGTSNLVEKIGFSYLKAQVDK